MTGRSTSSSAAFGRSWVTMTGAGRSSGRCAGSATASPEIAMADRTGPFVVRDSVFAKLIAVMLTTAASLLLLVAVFFWFFVSPSVIPSIDHGQMVRAHVALLALLLCL